ncbi:RES domain-containing protein [Sphaerotilus sp.]|uniref:RES family NAD+ phosphorylase n=1 Tax=Sphaerotilus sp. TaxID=2093942 RepID=UPI00286E7EF5|nr:RES domain-containing protein [Sphaerotilus sp.]
MVPGVQMAPLPAALGGRGLVAWRLERTRYRTTWQSAEGAYLVGGRWSSRGRRVLYASLDPSTTVVEVAVHKGFHVLDTVPHTLLSLEVDPAGVHVVQPDDVPNPHWLSPGTVSVGQQRFGDALLDRHALVVVPSVVSARSWNLLIHVEAAAGRFRLRHEERFALDTRLNAPATAAPAPPTAPPPAESAHR